MQASSALHVAARLLAQVRAGAAARLQVDARGLAALRIAAGLLVLADLALRLPDLVAFYTDEGALPRSGLRRLSPWLSLLSVHSWAGARWYVGALFAVAAVGAVAVAVGYRTRLATIVSVVLLASLLLRNPLVLNAGDSLLLFLLVWGAFLPWGARWSLDARRPGSPRPPATVGGSAAAGLLVQVVLMYATNAVFKARSGAWSSGEALQYVFGAEEYTTGLGAWLASSAGLLSFLGRGWYALLWAAPLLLLLRGPWRLGLVALFASGHAGMLLTMRVGLFPFISLAALLPFIPPAAWDEASRLADRWRAPQASSPKPGDALAPVEAPPFRMSRPAALAAALVLATMLGWSAVSLGAVDVPAAAEPFVDRHGEGWAMFARPRTSQVWVAVPGLLESGEEVDVLRGTAVSLASPAQASPYPDIRWPVYLAKLGREGATEHDFAQYLCRRWDASHDDRLVALTVQRVEQPIDPRGPDPAPTATQVHRHDCAA